MKEPWRLIPWVSCATRGARTEDPFRSSGLQKRWPERIACWLGKVGWRRFWQALNPAGGMGSRLRLPAPCPGNQSPSLLHAWAGLPAPFRRGGRAIQTLLTNVGKPVHVPAVRSLSSNNRKPRAALASGLALGWLVRGVGLKMLKHYLAAGCLQQAVSPVASPPTALTFRRPSTGYLVGSAFQTLRSSKKPSLPMQPNSTLDLVGWAMPGD